MLLRVVVCCWRQRVAGCCVVYCMVVGGWGRRVIRLVWLVAGGSWRSWALCVCVGACVLLYGVGVVWRCVGSAVVVWLACWYAWYGAGWYGMVRCVLV